MEDINEKLKWKFLKSNLIGYLGFVLALIIFFLGTPRDCSVHEQLNEQRYLIDAQSFRPLLKIVDYPIFDLLLLNVSEETARHIVSEIRNKTHTPPTDTFLFPIQYSCELKITNTGNVAANIVLWLCSDTLAGKEEWLRDKLFNSAEFTFTENKNFYHNYYVDIGDTIFIKSDGIFNYPINNIVGFHFYLLYGNESKQLFETYYWSRIKFPYTPIEVVAYGTDSFFTVEYNPKIIIQKSALTYLDHYSVSRIIPQREIKQLTTIVDKIFESASNKNHGN